jgi:hypothetical protein
METEIVKKKKRSVVKREKLAAVKEAAKQAVGNLKIVM